MLPATKTSLLNIDNPAVTLLTWKGAEDGDGTVLRLQESGGKASQVTISSPFLSFEQAWRCSVLEENQTAIPTENGRFSVSLQPFQTLTIRVHTVPTVKKEVPSGN
jgi:alpha-mannosidase